MLLFACLGLLAPAVLAQELEGPTRNSFSFASVNLIAGRTGAPLGPGGTFETGPPAEFKRFPISTSVAMARAIHQARLAGPRADGNILRDADDPPRRARIGGAGSEPARPRDEPGKATRTGSNDGKIPASNHADGFREERADHSTRTWAILNAINVGVSFAAASASYHGAKSCGREAAGQTGTSYSEHENPGHNFRQTLGYALPFDVGVGIASYALRHKHGMIAKLLPLLAASAKSGVAGMNYSAGCF